MAIMTAPTESPILKIKTGMKEKPHPTVPVNQTAQVKVRVSNLNIHYGATAAIKNVSLDIILLHLTTQ